MRKGRFVSRCLAVFVALSSAATAQSAATTPKAPAFSPPPESPKQLSVAEIGSMFERPKNSQDLLKNLKLAMDKDLLLQRAFFEDANLLKFFNGTKVEWEKPDPYAQHQHWANITADDRTFPKMAIRVLESRWLTPSYKMPNGAQTKEHENVAGNIQLRVGDVTVFTARDVTSVFGTPSSKEFDSGVLTDGHSEKPRTKGNFLYEVGWKKAGKQYFRKKAVIYFKLDPPIDTDIPAYKRKFTEGDVVKSIELYEME